MTIISIDQQNKRSKLDDLWCFTSRPTWNYTDHRDFKIATQNPSFIVTCPRGWINAMQNRTARTRQEKSEYCNRSYWNQTPQSLLDYTSLRWNNGVISISIFSLKSGNKALKSKPLWLNISFRKKVFSNLVGQNNLLQPYDTGITIILSTQHLLSSSLDSRHMFRIIDFTELKSKKTNLIRPFKKCMEFKALDSTVSSHSLGQSRQSSTKPGSSQLMRWSSTFQKGINISFPALERAATGWLRRAAGKRKANTSTSTSRNKLRPMNSTTKPRVMARICSKRPITSSGLLRPANHR